MFDAFLISKKELGELKVTLKNPLAITCEKITQNPRAHSTSEIKSAIENISILDVKERIIPEVIIKAVNYILKDFFLYMHQSGLYNRQLNLWRILSHVSQIHVFELLKGFTKKVNLSTYLIYFQVEERSPCIVGIINEKNTDSYSELKTCLDKILGIINKEKLKGVFYFTSRELGNDFMTNIITLTEAHDPISKYESIICGTKNTRLNLIKYKKENKDYLFEHMYPKLRGSKSLELEIN